MVLFKRGLFRFSPAIVHPKFSRSYFYTRQKSPATTNTAGMVTASTVTNNSLGSTNNSVSSHYEKHSTDQSYEQAYFYEPGAYMQHLISLTQSRLQLPNERQKDGQTTSTPIPAATAKRRILDIGGGTGNFARELLLTTCSNGDGDNADSKNRIEIVVVDPFLDPTTTSSSSKNYNNNVWFVKAAAEDFRNDYDGNGNDDWREPGSYHQILMKEIVHHLDPKDRCPIFQGMYQGLQPSTLPTSILIITRPQVDIDYPLWDEARQVWKDNQPSIEEIVDDLKQAGFVNVEYTIESYPCRIAVDRWQSMIRQRFWSTFSKFTDEELVDACRRIGTEYRTRIDDQGVISFEDRLVFITARKQEEVVVL